MPDTVAKMRCLVLSLLIAFQVSTLSALDLRFDVRHLKIEAATATKEEVDAILKETENILNEACSHPVGRIDVSEDAQSNCGFRLTLRSFGALEN